MKRLTPFEKLERAEETYLKESGWTRHVRKTETGQPLTPLFSPPQKLVKRVGKIMASRGHALLVQRDIDRWPSTQG